MLLKQFGIDPNQALASHGVCRECLALPVGERKKLAEKAIKEEQDEYRRDLTKDTLTLVEQRPPFRLESVATDSAFV
jgi:hypothetical protein